MNSRKKQLQRCRLYLILDASVNTYDELIKISQWAVRSGVDILQLRDKKGTAQDILKCSKEILKIADRKVFFIINDRVDLAKAVSADGVHLGQEDLSVNFARRLLGAKAIIGRSCQTLEHVKQAHLEKVDYIGFGSVFKTLTKPERKPMNREVLKKVMAQSTLPVFAIGGVTLENVSSLMPLGVNRVAVCREICLAKDVGKVTGEFKRKLIINYDSLTSSPFFRERAG